MLNEGHWLFEKMVDAKHRQMDQSQEIERLWAALTQIEQVAVYALKPHS